jgi:hypothetical protein
MSLPLCKPCSFFRVGWSFVPYMYVVVALISEFVCKVPRTMCVCML